MFIVTESIRITPLTNAVIPAILFEFTVETNGFELITSVDGVLVSKDEKVLSYLVESDPHVRKASEYPRGKLCATNTRHDEDLNRPTDYRIKMMAILNDKTIDYIEEVRNKTSKNDVVLKMRIRVKKLVSNAVISRIKTESQRDNKDFLTFHREDKQADPKIKDLWILSADDGPIFLNMTELIEEVTVTIPSSDWIHDYAPQFGIGKFLVVEMPIITPDLQPANEFEKRIDEAIKALPKMEEKIKNGEWDDVRKEARPVIELLHKSPDDIKALLTDIGYIDQSADELIKGIKNIFDHVSKSVHKLDKTGSIIPDFKVEKEDAYLIYSLATSLVNLLSRKISKTK